jgi:hypothetical protein
MTGKKKPPPAEPGIITVQDRLPPQQLVKADEVLATTAVATEMEKLNHIANLLWLPKGLEPQARDARILAALDVFESLKPSDGLEAMLAVQMVGTHNAAAECLRRAMLPDQTFEGRQASLSQAQKMMSLYLQQVAALDKHRGKGQRITVERLNVGAGGQAVVGDVHAAPPTDRLSSAKAAADTATGQPPALTAADPQLDQPAPAREPRKTSR